MWAEDNLQTHTRFTLEHPMKSFSDIVSASVIYLGWSLETDCASRQDKAIWRIQKLVKEGNVWVPYNADGDWKYDNTWADRAGLAYL